jgi:hypothetical protein
VEVLVKTGCPVQTRSGSRIALLCGVLLCAALTACNSPVSFATSEVSTEQSALSYYAWLQQASAEAITAEQAKLSAVVTPVPPQQLVKQAMLLTMAETATAEQFIQAQQLLQQATEYQLFGQHWSKVLELRQARLLLIQQGDAQLVAINQAQTSQAELQQRYNLLSNTLVQRERQVTELQQRLDVLQKQLNALTGIEQQLVEQEP